VRRGDVLRWTARRLPGVGDGLHDELVATVDELAGRGRRIDRVLEIGSLVGFSLRSASRRGAFDSRPELIRQGVRVGALVLAVAGALLSWTTAPSDLAVTGVATLLAVAIAGGSRTGAVVLATVAAVLTTLDGGPQPLALVVLGAVAVGHRFDARPCPIGAAVTAVAVVGTGVVAANLPAPTATTVLMVMIGVLPVALLAVGWFDPRFAVAGTVVWVWRFLAVDAHELIDALQALGDRAAFRLLVARWLLMGAGVVLGWHLSKAAIDRCLTVRRR
jgi:hypothetical protein